MSNNQKRRALLAFHRKQYELNIGKMEAARQRAAMHKMSIDYLEKGDE